MGYIRHHAIVVTCYDRYSVEKAHTIATRVFESMVSNITESWTNCFFSFFICPDGSKEGWERSDQGDTDRRLFLNELDQLAHEDGSTAFRYVEVFYGDDDGRCGIVSSN